MLGFVKDERAPHLVLLLLLTFTSDGHRNISCNKASFLSHIEPKVPQASSPIVVKTSPVVLERVPANFLPRHPLQSREGQVSDSGGGTGGGGGEEALPVSETTCPSLRRGGWFVVMLVL